MKGVRLLRPDTWFGTEATGPASQLDGPRKSPFSGPLKISPAIYSAIGLRRLRPAARNKQRSVDRASILRALAFVIEIKEAASRRSRRYISRPQRQSLCQKSASQRQRREM